MVPAGHGRMNVIVLMVLLFVAGGLVPAGAAKAQSDVPPDLKGSVDRLRDLREDLEAKRQRSRDLGGREKGMLEEIRGLEESLNLTKKILRGLEQRETSLSAELSSTRSALDEAGTRLDVRKKELARVLRQMYKHGRYHSLEILFSSRSFPNLLERFRFLGSVAGRNRQMLGAVEEEQARYDEVHRSLLGQSRELENLKQERQREQRRIESDVGQRTRILEGVRNEKSEYDRMVGDLERSAVELEALIARMEAESERRPPAAAGDFGARKGALPLPVNGEKVVAFGKHRHPKFGTVTFSNGEDYRAPLGSPVRAVAPAVVEHVSWLTGYGQCVILSHGNGYYTLYAHCSEVFVEAGQEVREGARIASVGETGSLIGPSLHFEIRRGREALDPADWLRSR
jgi:septal ring factor EnvC (AmiA/AmiB activator)